MTSPEKDTTVSNELLTIKYEIIAHLILKYNLRLEDICSLNPQEFAKYIDSDIRDNVTKYINKNGDRIRETKYFFYGKTGGPSSVGSIIAGLRKNLSAEVFNSLRVSTIKEKEKFLPPSSSIKDIQDFLKNM